MWFGAGLDVWCGVAWWYCLVVIVYWWFMGDLLLCGNCGLLVVVLLGMLWLVGLAVGYRFTVVVYLLLLMVSWYCRLVAARLVVDSWVYSFTDCVVFLGACFVCV